MTDPSPRSGEVWLIAFDPAIGGEIQKTRPAVVVSNDTANALLNQIQVVPVSSHVGRLYPAEAVHQPQRRAAQSHGRPDHNGEQAPPAARARGALPR